ncbi:MAG: FHA domain-containing serine/threonine-protein kinase [Pyrinomonadaceae bacterium]
MNNCYECGSEIAEIDTFCPFCGIVLNPNLNSEDLAVESSTLTDEQDNTAAIENSNLPKILPQPDSVSPETPVLNDLGSTDIEISNSPQPSENNINLPEIKEFSESRQAIEKAKEIIPVVSPDDLTMIDVPRPQVLPENAEKASSLEDNKNVPEEVSEISDSSVKTEIAGQSILENEIGQSILEKEVKEDFNENEFIQTIPYVNYKLQENQITLETESPKFDEDDQIILPQPDQTIEKPDIPVEFNQAHDTTFDSVKIIEDTKNHRDEEQPKVISTDDVKAGFKQEKKVESVNVKEKERSQTTPNFGAGNTDGRKSPKLKPLDEGTVLNGRYEIVRKIGGGGMGAVYLATDRNLGGILRAVKEMIQSYVEEVQQDKAISDFKRESMLLTSLDHSSIPTIYDYFYDEKEGRFYLVMKYISGGDLASRLRSAPEGRIDEETVVSWAAQIADVLDYLHNRQPPIVYRDLKPANIMIDGNTGRTMLIDFGIARWINKEEKGVTAVGTMGYAPPELFSGKVEPSSDIYSLGSTMFHLLTGADPQSNPLLIFDFQKHPRPRQINPQLSDQIENILLKMVEYSADKRHKSAGDVRDELTQHLENLKSGKATFGISKAPSAVSFSDQLVFCGFCGQKIVATDMFCAFCGSKQPLAQQGVNSAEYHLQQPTAKLFVVGTNELEVPTFVIEKDDNLVGRRDPLSNIFPEVDLSKFDPQTKISRRHAHIWRDGNNFLLEDLGSSNGTLVLRVVGDAIKLNPHQPHNLVNGEKIRIGDTTLHFAQT